jgi:hypothetical protein
MSVDNVANSKECCESLLTPGANRAIIHTEGTDVLRPDLERLERTLIAALYNVWRLMGKQRKIIHLG